MGSFRVFFVKTAGEFGGRSRSEQRRSKLRHELTPIGTNDWTALAQFAAQSGKETVKFWTSFRGQELTNKIVCVLHYHFSPHGESCGLQNVAYVFWGEISSVHRCM